MAFDQEYESGGVGAVRAGGQDWSVNNADITINAGSQDTTTTSNYNATKKKLFTAKTATNYSASGSFAFFWDKNNPPNDALDPGQYVELEVDYPNGKKFHAGQVFIDSLSPPTGGVGGVFSCTVNWSSHGEFEWE